MVEETQPLWKTAVELGAWSVPTVGAAWLTLRAPRGEKRQWGFIALACGVFAIDELFDILGSAYRAVRDLARTIDPEHAFRGENAYIRWIALGLGAVLGLATLLYLFRGRRTGLPKWIAFSGICTVMVYLFLRLVPRIGDLTEGPVGLGILGLAWVLLMFGIVLEFDRLRDD